MSEPIKPQAILLVDGDAARRAATKRLLRQRSLPYEVLEVETVPQALAAVERARPACVILEGDAPELPSDVLLDGLRSVDAPVVILVAREDRADALLRAGAHDVLGKDGLTAHSLSRTVENAIVRWQMQSEAFANAQMLQLALESARTGIWKQDLRTDAVTWSPECYEIFGVKPDFALASAADHFALVHPDDRAPMAAAVRAAIESRSAYSHEFRVLRPDGTIRWLRALGRVSTDARGTPVTFLGTVFDISPRKRAEAELAAREREFRTLADNSPAIIARYDRDFRVTYVNGAIEALTPGGRGSIIGKSVRELHITAEQLDEFEGQARAAFATGQPQRTELSYAPPEGPRYYERTLVPELDGSGEVVSLLSLAYDVTDRKLDAAALRATQEKLRQALEQAEHAVKTRDNLVALVSHDLRSPLNTVMLGVSALEEELAGPQRSVLGRMARQCRKMEGLIDELLDVAQITAGAPLALQPAQTDLAELVRTLMQDHRGVSPAHTLELSATANPLIGTWDTKRVARVITNLLSNAIKYSPAGGRVRLRLERAPGPPSFALLSVTDEGIGISPDDRDRIFDWFARGANARGTRIQGTGIGLAASREIVQQHGGVIEVESAPGEGSTFTVRLPLGPNA